MILLLLIFCSKNKVKLCRKIIKMIYGNEKQCQALYRSIIILGSFSSSFYAASHVFLHVKIAWLIGSKKGDKM